MPYVLFNIFLYFLEMTVFLNHFAILQDILCHNFEYDQDISLFGGS